MLTMPIRCCIVNIDYDTNPLRKEKPMKLISEVIGLETDLKRVWISRDMDGRIDVWRKRPTWSVICNCGVFVNNSPNKIIANQMLNQGILKHFTDQLGEPELGELWVVTLTE